MDDYKSDSEKSSMLARSNTEEGFDHNSPEQQRKDDPDTELVDREDPTSSETYESKNSKGNGGTGKKSQNNLSNDNDGAYQETPKDDRESTERNLDFLTHLARHFQIHSNIVPLEFVFSKIVAVILKSKGYTFTHQLQIELTQISSKYFDSLVQSLHNFTEYQRRRKPSIRDLSLCLKEKSIDLNQLYEHFLFIKSFSAEINNDLMRIKKQTDEISKDLNNNQVSPSDPSLCFFEDEKVQITKIVPQEITKSSYVPPYLPDFPPDFTYHRTPNYVDRVTDLKELRKKLVEESRLTGNSLYNLIEDDEERWKQEFEKQIGSENTETFNSDDSDGESEIMSDRINSVNYRAGAETPISEHAEADSEAPHKVESLETFVSSPQRLVNKNEEQPADALQTSTLSKADGKRFDYVVYAHKRKSLLEGKEEKIQEKRKKRENNIFMQAEKYYSPYAIVTANSSVDELFKNVVDEECKSLIFSVKRAENKQKIGIQKYLEEKEKRDSELSQKAQRGLGYNAFSLLAEDIDSDVESDSGSEEHPLDFMQPNNPSSPNISEINGNGDKFQEPLALKVDIEPHEQHIKEEEPLGYDVNTPGIEEEHIDDSDLISDS